VSPLGSRRWTLSTRLVVILAVVVSLVVVVAATISTLAVRSFLEQRVSSRLESVSSRLQAGLLGLPDLTIDTPTIARMAHAETTAVVLEADGRAAVLVNTDPRTADLLIRTDLRDGRAHPVPGAQGLVAIRMSTAASGLTVRDGARAVHPDAIVVALDLRADLHTLDTLVLVNTGGVLLAVGLLVLLTLLIVSRSIRPLRTMAEQARAFADGDRSRRLPVPVDPDIGRLATTVNSALDAQQEAESRLRSFVADASHELRTPLTTASGWVELYLQGGLDDPANRENAMRRVAAQLSRMRLLIDELALLARLDRARPLDTTSVDLTALATEVIEDARVMNPDRRFRFRSTGPALLLGDAGKLQQVLANLLGNAVQHTPPGTPVDVSVLPAGDGTARHTLLVTDHGPGIPVADQPHIFTRFWRGDPSRNRHTGGSGLGLAIVAATVAAHGGSSHVSSELGHGTTIRVVLPALPLGDDRPGPGAEARPAEPPAPVQPQPSTATSTRSG
jgi:two-component system OmpR family sensor kinase